MKIHVHSEKHSFTIVLPTRMIFSKSLLKLGLKIGRKYSDQVSGIPPEAINALCKEIRRVKKIHKSWELVNAQSADGDSVQIYL